MSERETLLIVEDNVELRDGLKEILISEGYTVFTAGNGREAIEQMHLISPDLVLSDITMPEMDGYELFRQIRQMPEGLKIPFIFLTAHGAREEVLRGKRIGIEDYLVKPVTRAELITTIQSRLSRFRELQLAQLSQAYQSSLTLLANAIELRDQYTRGHVERVTAYTLVLAEYLGFRGAQMESIRFGSILHDIGKILVNEQIWMKATPLNSDERIQIRTHAERGAEMVKDITYLAGAVPMIRSHHERWDGSGYPDGLAGEQIPYEARVIAVADSFDAMTTHRPYHQAVSLQQAFDVIVQGSGSLYDPNVVAAFQKAWEAGRIQQISERWAAREHSRVGDRKESFT
jgi:putative two-component system response regulator